MNLEVISKLIIEMAEKDKELRSQKVLDWDQINNLDKANRLKIKQIINKYGYIHPKIFGEKASKSAWLLIQHFPPRSVKFMEKYLHLIKANDENFDKRTLAMFEDRINISKNLPQIYGTQAYKAPGSEIFYFREIKDIKNIDKRREEIGLETLAEYVKSIEKDWGDKIVLPKGYKE